jgi:superfamily II DNA/RNA helicase
MDQSSRIAELDRFKSGEVNILVASDVAARGLDIKGVSHVFNYDTPWHPDDYVHRIGRTGRAGAKGRAFTLVTPEDAEAIGNVEKLTGMQIPVFEAGAAEPEKEREEERPRREARPRRERAERPPREKPKEAEKPAPEPRRAPPRREPEPEPAEADEPGEWNGPVPGFLGMSVL